MTRVGILTGGGDVPGLNSVIKSVVYRATELGWEALGLRGGWQGLTHQPPGAEPDPAFVRPLDRRGTRAIDRLMKLTRVDEQLVLVDDPDDLVPPPSS